DSKPSDEGGWGNTSSPCVGNYRAPAVSPEKAEKPNVIAKMVPMGGEMVRSRLKICQDRLELARRFVDSLPEGSWPRLTTSKGPFHHASRTRSHLPVRDIAREPACSDVLGSI